MDSFLFVTHISILPSIFYWFPCYFLGCFGFLLRPLYFSFFPPWAFTLSLFDVCFQDYFLESFFSFTQFLFGTLSFLLGCFPLDYQAYPYSLSPPYLFLSSRDGLFYSRVIYFRLDYPVRSFLSIFYLRYYLYSFRSLPAISKFD